MARRRLSRAFVDRQEAQLLQEMTQPTEVFHRRHCISGLLGKGAFARVYTAQRSEPEGDRSSTEVAVKVTDLQVESREAQSLRQHLEREVEILMAVRGQRHSVQCIEHYFEDRFSYIVMERCKTTLPHMLEQLPKVTEAVIARALKDILQGLDGIHQMGIVHRDLKPDNFLFSGTLRDGVVKICDFGLADMVSARRPQLRGVQGTAPYVSPEMLKGDGYDTRTDMWSFWVVAYILLLGQFPYTPRVQGSKEMQNAIVCGSPPPAFKPTVGRASEGAVGFLREMFARSPRNRLDAQQVLRRPWLLQHADLASNWEAASSSNLPDLSDVLQSAYSQGAYTSNNTSSGFNFEAGDCPWERQLSELQEKHHNRHRASGPSEGMDWKLSQESVGSRSTRASGPSGSAPNSCSSEETLRGLMEGAAALPPKSMSPAFPSPASRGMAGPADRIVSL